ncbi:MAG: alpha-mannosidase [Verrucomicrobia bacterium]|nr:alpha-mannosidase [Verrucomicrobiota bacterium]
MDRTEKLSLSSLKCYVSLIESRVVREAVAADDLRLVDPAEPRFDAPPDDAPWQPIGERREWGGEQQWTWFRATVAVPEHWTSGAIELRLVNRAEYKIQPNDANNPAGPEGQVLIDGARVGAIDKQHARIRHAFKPGATHDVRAIFFAARIPCRHILQDLSIAWVDTATETLAYDLRVALDVIDNIDENSLGHVRLVRAIEAAVQALDVRDVPLSATGATGDLFYASVPAAQRAFDEARRAVPVAGDAPKVVSVGHAHIDLAWLWSFEQTKHKCVRTWATQVRLLNQYPGWTFHQSSPQAYKWAEQHAPDLFAQIKTLIKAGRWEADGATWCEMDTNITGGESLVRQFLYGKRYFREKLGVDSRIFWLPDVFGYSAALPQIMRLAGVDGFVTSKISWNQFNRFPYDTFRWRGIDGTETVTHYITGPCLGMEWMSTYNTMMSPYEVKRSWLDYAQRRLLDETLVTFGYGDGGGGPTEKMLEQAERLATMPLVEGMPRVHFEKSAALIERIRQRVDELPVWDGELYLEYHRGTYTTQAWLKRANRKNEARLHNVEWLATLAAPHGHRLDKAKLDALWEDMLLIQFHDVLPGSSVREVYDDSAQMENAIAEQADGMIGAAADALVAQIDTSAYTKPLVLFNTLSWDRSEAVKLPDGTWRDGVTVPACGWTVIDLAERDKAPSVEAPTVSKDGSELSNAYWQMRLDKQGRIAELYDRVNDRQVLAPGAVANEWQVFEDRPLDSDAWDIDLFYMNHPLPQPELASLKVVEPSGARVAVELMWRLPKVGGAPQSTITQRIALYAGSPRIDFETHVDWHVHHHLLKVAFPVDVRATDAAYQIQFGHLRRPTHTNTLWDIARFEVCAHQFVDLGEHGYGVSLLNDCKYGHDVRDNVIRLTCIKSPQSPDPIADQGEHTFTYALLPHAGTFQQAGTVRAASELNVPLVMREAKASKGTLPATWSYVRVEGDAAVIDTIKAAEDGKGTILRLYESHGSHAPVTLTFATAPKSVEHLNLLEEPFADGIDLEHNGAKASFRMRPFQIVTLRVR